MDLARGKQSDLAQFCIYEIATGKWPQGMKLPSVRDAEKMWGVNRLMILNVYRDLEMIGLVISKDRSGFYVRETNRVVEENKELQELYHEIKSLIKKRTPHNLGYVMKYFDTLFISESQADPHYAFLECTDYQATDHANEIYEKLNTYIKPICIPSSGQLLDLPESIHTLLTTGFHIEEVKRIGKHHGKNVELVPIEIDPAIFQKQSIKQLNSFLFVEFEGNMSSNISKDLLEINPDIKLTEKVISSIDNELPHLIENDTYQRILLSPRLWGRLPPALRRNKKLQVVRFRISPSSWKRISDVLKIPLVFG